MSVDIRTLKLPMQTVLSRIQALQNALADLPADLRRVKIEPGWTTLSIDHKSFNEIFNGLECASYKTKICKDTTIISLRIMVGDTVAVETCYGCDEEMEHIKVGGENGNSRKKN